MNNKPSNNDMKEWSHVVKKQMYYFRNVFTIEKEDLKQEIYIGLIIGLNTFKEGLATKEGYLINRIRQHVLRFIQNTSRLIRIPCNIHDNIIKAVKVDEKKRTEKEKELCNKGMQQSISLEEEYLCGIADNAFEESLVKEFSNIMQKEISVISYAQKEILHNHYIEGVMLKDVAEDMGITIKQARSHRNSTLERLRRNVKLKMLLSEMKG